MGVRPQAIIVITIYLLRLHMSSTFVRYLLDRDQPVRAGSRTSPSLAEDACVVSVQNGFNEGLDFDFYGGLDQNIFR